jgi:glutathione synthase/RimK-type ligase-like ATP-grasp enzyme
MTVAIATCRHRELVATDGDDEVLIEALARLGIRAEPAVWDDPDVAWEDHDLVVIRTTWDYDTQRDAFVDWAQAVEAVTSLQNPAEVVRWNTHKGYLIELEERGVPTVPTAWLGAGDTMDLGALAASRRWDDGVVVKPAVGAGSRGLVVVDDHAADGQAALDALLGTGDVMVQPLLHRIAEEGELSLVCLDGRYSHAVRKLPRHGERRIQVEFGGSYVPATPTEDLVALAEWVVEATGHDLLYARVDLVPGEDGTWQVSEVEATEPSLYLDRVEGAADRAAAAIAARL